MSFPVNVDRIIVYSREGFDTDVVQFLTNYSNPKVYFGGIREKGGLIMQFETTKDYGVEYVRTVFGIEPETRGV